MMIRHKNTTLVKTYALCWVSLQLRWWFSSFLFWTLGKGSHVTVELDMGHLCFLWTLRREKGCWSTSAECPKQFGVSMPMDAIDRSGFGMLIVIFWWAGKISDLDLFYRVFKLIFDWGHQAATGEVCKAIIWISHWFAMQPSEDLMRMGDYMDGFDMVIHFRLCSSFYFMGLQMSTKQLILRPSNNWEKPWSISCPIGSLAWTTRLWS